MLHPAYNPTSSVKFYTFLTNNLDLNGYGTELCNLEFKPEEGHWYLTIRVTPKERYHGKSRSSSSVWTTYRIWETARG